MTINTELYEKIECNSAREFVNQLRASNELWLEDKEIQSKWIFRGQGNIKYKLLPTALREPNFNEAKRIFLENKLSIYSRIHDICRDTEPHYGVSLDYNEDEINQILNDKWIIDIFAVATYEMELAKQFATFVDNLGFPIPSTSQAFLATIGQLLDVPRVLSDYIIHCLIISPQIAERLVFSSKSHPVIALTRHHGIPSSLIDFTENPIIAAFFAADSAERDTDITVWAIHSSVIGERNRLRMLDVFRSELGYLHAQDGILIYDSQSDQHYMQYGKWACISDNFTHENFAEDSKKVFKCVTLPSSEAKEVLRLLRAEKIAKPYLMPSFNTIADTIVEQFEFPNL